MTNISRYMLSERDYFHFFFCKFPIQYMNRSINQFVYTIIMIMIISIMIQELQIINVIIMILVQVE